MQSVFRKTSSRKLPADAQLIQRNGEAFAKIRDRNGKRQVVKVTKQADGSLRALIPDRNFTAKYRDADGRIVTRSTGCADKDAALTTLAGWIRQAELVKSNVLTKTESRVSEYQNILLLEHIATYVDHLKRRKKNTDRINSTESRLVECIDGCCWSKLADMSADELQSYLDNKQVEGMGAGSLNGRIDCWVSFGYWLAGKRMNGKRSNWNGDKRITTNPFEGFARYDAKSDCRRKRRSLTEQELIRLLKVAKERPLIDATTVRTGKRKGEQVANLRDETRQRLEKLGRERALIYKTMVLTGLRKKELKSITIGQCHLTDSRPFIELASIDEKNRKGSDIPIRCDLAAELAEWIKDNKAERQTIRIDDKSNAADPDRNLFTVPAGLVRILNRDLKAADIPKVDERGYSVDVHAMRHSFGSLLSQGGVAPRTAQAAMRHSSIDLTMNVYTDPKLLDVHAALDSLPRLEIDRNDHEMKATGTDANRAAPNAAPKSGYVSKSEHIRDNSQVKRSDCQESKTPRKTSSLAGVFGVEPKGVEPSTSALRTQRSPN